MAECKLTLMVFTDVQGQPTFAPPPQHLPNHDEKHALGLDPGYLGMNAQQVNYAAQQYAAGYHPMSYRPSLGIETSGPSFQAPQMQFPSAQSSAPSSILPDTASLHDGEHLTTPGMPYVQNFSSFTPNYGYAEPPQPTNQPHWTEYITPESNTNSLPDFSASSSQGTISPSQLSHEQLKPIRTFSDLMMNSRASSSSASSDGTQEFSSALEDWTKPVSRALAPIRTSPQATVPEPVRRAAEVTWAMPAAPQQRANNPSIIVPGNAPTVPNPEALANALHDYVHSPNRLKFGERKITVMSPKVGQKSYGTEKRFLCPHPQAVLVGSSWWRPADDNCPRKTRLPPRINISLDGENAVKDAVVSWTTVDGKNLDEKINTETLRDDEEPFIGNVAGRNLHISDVDAKRRESRARVVVRAPHSIHAGQHGWGQAKGTMTDTSNDEIIGQFDSKDIKIISKPSKKKATAKSSERELRMLIASDSSLDSAWDYCCIIQPSQVANYFHSISLRRPRPNENSRF